jgi:hypothetical protein
MKKLKLLTGLLAFLFLPDHIQAQQTGTCTAGTQYCEDNGLTTINTTTTTNTNTNVNTNVNTNENTNVNTNQNTNVSTNFNNNVNSSTATSNNTNTNNNVSTSTSDSTVNSTVNQNVTNASTSNKLILTSTLRLIQMSIFQRQIQTLQLITKMLIKITTYLITRIEILTNQIRLKLSTRT